MREQWAPTESRLPFLVGISIGAPLVAVATYELVSEAGSSGAIAVGRWLVGANLVHDLVIAPMVCVTGWVVARVVPRALRAPIEAGTIVSGVLLIVAFPVLRGYGRDQVPGNPTVQPLDYVPATLTALGAVWAIAAAWTVVRLVTTSQVRPGR
jgi:hypothetical protein